MQVVNFSNFWRLKKKKKITLFYFNLFLSVISSSIVVISFEIIQIFGARNGCPKDFDSVDSGCIEGFLIIKHKKGKGIDRIEEEWRQYNERSFQKIFFSKDNLMGGFDFFTILKKKGVSVYVKGNGFGSFFKLRGFNEDGVDFQSLLEGDIQKKLSISIAFQIFFICRENIFAIVCGAFI